MFSSLRGHRQPGLILILPEEATGGAEGQLPVPLPSYLVPGPSEALSVCPKPLVGAWQSPAGSCCSDSRAQSRREVKCVPWGRQWWPEMGDTSRGKSKGKLPPLKPVPHQLLHFCLSPHLLSLSPSPPMGSVLAWCQQRSSGRRQIPPVTSVSHRPGQAAVVSPGWTGLQSPVTLLVRASVLRHSWESRRRDRAPGMQTGARV